MNDLEPIVDRAGVERRIARIAMQGSPEDLRHQFLDLSDAREVGSNAEMGGVPVRILNPEAEKTLLFLHGGGYVFGSSLSHGACAEALADLLDWRVVLPDYRLAPEHPWPAQRDDACAVLDAVSGPVALAGDSAGGHLAISMALARPGRLSHLVLISPNTDRSGQSTTRGAQNDLMNDDESDRNLGEMAFGQRDPGDTEASPLLADLSSLPPIFMTASVNEVLLDDTLLFAAAAARAGVAVQTQILPPLFHMWTLWPQALPQARRSLCSIAKFLES